MPGSGEAFDLLDNLLDRCRGVDLDGGGGPQLWFDDGEVLKDGGSFLGPLAVGLLVRGAMRASSTSSRYRTCR
jgi:hypothetical protein